MARGIWKGTLGFGLVSIGVELYSAESPKGIDLDMLDRRDHAPIGYKKYNKATGQEIAYEEIVKGYEVSKGRYVILAAEDLKAANPKSTQTIDVIGFVPADDIALVYFDKPYVVGPLKGSEKAYALFVKTLEDTRQVGLAQVVIRTKQHVAAVYPHNEAIVVHLLRYHDELRQPVDLGLPMDSVARQNIRPQELTMARQLVESMSTEWKPEEFRDTYREDLLKLIETRASSTGESGVVSAATADSPEPRVLDLMAALKGSLAARAHDKVVRRNTKVASKAKTPAGKSTAVTSASRKELTAAAPAKAAAKSTRARKTGT